MNMAILPERIASKIARDPESDCWEWTAGRNNYGYGSVSMNSKSTLAHRVVYELLVGPIPQGLQIDHLCRNRGCVNPDHLEPVTQWENMQRGLSATWTHCPWGHEYTEANTYRRPGRETRLCRICRATSRKTWREREWARAVLA